MQELSAALAAQNDFSFTVLDTFLHSFVKEKNLNTGDVLPVLRIMLSGTKNGPAVYEIASLLGKEKTLERMKTAEGIFDKMIVR